MNSDDKFTIALVIIACVTAIGLTCQLASCGHDTISKEIEGAIKQTVQDVPVQVEHANGCPLDAVAYDAPAFADCGSKSFRVTDRFSGASWWLLRMRGEWFVLPIEGKEAGK